MRKKKIASPDQGKRANCSIWFLNLKELASEFDDEVERVVDLYFQLKNVFKKYFFN